MLNWDYEKLKKVTKGNYIDNIKNFKITGFSIDLEV